MPPVLAKQMLGLPRWAWIAILAGGLTVGLILRSRRNAQESVTGGPSDGSGDAPPDASVGAATYDPYSDMYASGGGYPNEYYPAGSGSGYGQDQGYIYPPVDNSTMPDAVTPNVDITINTTAPPPVGTDSGKSCTKPKPTRPAGNGREWRCRGNTWVAVPKAGAGQGDGGGSGGQGDNKCGPRPSNPAGHNKKWVCRNGKWVKVQESRAGGNSTDTDQAKITGGGPPSRRYSHRPPPRAVSRRVG